MVVKYVNESVSCDNGIWALCSILDAFSLDTERLLGEGSTNANLLGELVYVYFANLSLLYAVTSDRVAPIIPNKKILMNGSCLFFPTENTSYSTAGSENDMLGASYVSICTSYISYGLVTNHHPISRDYLSLQAPDNKKES